MSKVQIPYDMEFFLDENLVEVAKNPEDMQKGISWIREKIAELPFDDHGKRCIYHTQISSYARILGDYEIAEEEIIKAITIVTGLGKDEQLISLNIRLAMIFALKKNYIRADSMFKDAIEKSKNVKGATAQKNLDFAVFQLGKSRFDQRFYKEALDLFMQSFEQRMIRGDMELMKQSEFATNKAKAKIEELMS